MIRDAAGVAFFFSFAFLFYTWILYPISVILVSRLFSHDKTSSDYLPSVSIVLACFNEEAQISERIENLLNLDYPREMLEIWVASDGSTDNTFTIAESYRGLGISTLNFATRRGRACVHNDMMGLVTGEIVMFTDASVRSSPDLLRKVARSFSDASVGCVLVEIDFVNRGETTIASHRGLYWRVEELMRRAESDLAVLAVGSGPCMAVRRGLFKPLVKSSYDVDFITALDVIAQSKRVVIAQGITVTDYLLSTPKGEFGADVRMVAKNFRGTIEHMFAIGLYRRPRVMGALISHKIFRWLTPFALFLGLISNAFLIEFHFLRVFLILQIAFYTLAAVGALGREYIPRHRMGSVFMIPFSFCLANLAFLWGIFKGLFGAPITAYQNVK